MAKAQLSPMFERVSGTMRGFVIAQTPRGTLFRRKPQYRYRPNEAQSQASERFRIATRAYTQLTLDEIEAWRAYADSLTMTDRVTGQRYSPQANAVFLGYATRLLQISPDHELPRLPPAHVYIPAAVAPTATAVPGGVEFLSSVGDPEGQLTEILLEPLANIRRRPYGRYRSAGFFAFEPNIPIELALPEGVFAFASRAVEAASGRTGLLTPVPGVFVVEASA